MPGRNSWLALLLGVATLVLVVFARLSLTSWLGPAPHFLLPFVLPVLVASWRGGWWPGLGMVAIAVGLMVQDGFQASVGVDLSLHSDQIRLGLYAGVGVIVAALCERLHHARASAQRAASEAMEQLHAARDEARVRESAEASLQASEAKLRLLVDAIPQLMWTCLDDGRAEYLSPQWVAHTGVPEAQHLGFGWREAVHPDDRGPMRASWEQAVHAGTVFTNTFRLRSASGEYHWFQTRAAPISTRDGQRRWFGASTDIDEMRVAQESLRETAVALEARVEERTQAIREHELRFQAIFHSQFQFIGLMSPDGMLLEANRTAMAAAGVHADDVIGRLFWDTVWWQHDAEQQERLRQAVRRAAAGEQVRFEANHPAADGSLIWVDFSLTPFIEDDGEVVLLIPEGRDITQRKQAESELRVQEARFRSAFDHAPIGIALVSTDGRWLRVNDAICRIVGYSEAELLAIDFQRITHPDDLSTDLDLLHDVLAGRRTAYQMEKRYLHKDGHLVPVQLSVSLVRDSNGQPLYFISQIVDISVHKLAESQMRASLREKEVLVKEIHHRVKNNLQIVSTMLDLQSDYTTDPQALSLFAESRNRVRSMALIHERLYRTQDMARVPVMEYIARLAEELYRSYHVSEADVRLTLDVDIPPLSLDVAIPCGLLLNELMSNCFKHAFRDGGEGSVTVSFREAMPGWNCLRVADDGVGLSAGAQGALTGSFGWQLVNTLVEQLQGTLSIEPPPTDSHGTIISIVFPAESHAPVSGVSA